MVRCMQPMREGRCQRSRWGTCRGRAAHQEGRAGQRAQAGGQAGDAAGARARVPEQRAAAVGRAQRAQVVHRHAARLVRARQQPPARQHLPTGAGGKFYMAAASKVDTAAAAQALLI